MTAKTASHDCEFTSPELREWRRFVVAILLAIWPSLIVIGSLEAIAWHAGETMSMEAVAQWQSAKPGRMWRSGDDRFNLSYRVARARLLKPDVMIIGHSRTTQFRADSFKPYTFYNAGLSVWTFNHYRRLLELVADGGYAPRVLVFN